MNRYSLANILACLFAAFGLTLILQAWAPEPVQAQSQPTATSVAVQATSPATPTPTIPAPVHVAPGPAASLQGFSYIQQTFNNCGPATLAMLLSYYNTNLTQATIGAALRPNQDDKNVSPVELAEYARSLGYNALVRVNGNRDRLRTLIANNIPVIIETWLEPHPNDGLGHYRMLVGYDDAQEYWIGYDSYYRENLINPGGAYQGIRMDYAETDGLWAVFNRTYVVVYPQAQAATVASILGTDGEDGQMWTRALANALAATAQQKNNPFAWFNLGTDLTALGRYEEAAVAYDRARGLGLPPRMLWYQFGPFQAYHEVGRHEDVIALADQVLKPAVQIEELHYWKAEALAALADEAGAAQARQRVAQLNANFRPEYGQIALVPATSAQAAVSTVDTTVMASVAQPPAVQTPVQKARAAFIADVTVPDGSVVAPEERLVKIWRVRNSGDLAWEGYRVQAMPGYEWSTDQAGAPASVPIATTQPGETVDIRLLLTAPSQAGQYTGYWQIVSAEGEPVSGGQLWAMIEVAGRAQP